MSQPIDNNGNSIPVLAIANNQVVSSSAGASTPTPLPIGATSFFIHATVATYIKVGATPVASSADFLIPPGQVLSFACNPTDKVAVRSLLDTGNVHIAAGQ